MLLTKQRNGLSRTIGLVAWRFNGYWTLFYLSFGEKTHQRQLTHAHSSVHCASMSFKQAFSYVLFSDLGFSLLIWLHFEKATLGESMCQNIVFNKNFSWRNSCQGIKTKFSSSPATLKYSLAAGKKVNPIKKRSLVMQLSC